MEVVRDWLTDASVFGRLGHLHTFKLTGCKLKELKLILQAFVDHGIQLKRLILPTTYKIPIDIICRMESIEYLELHHMDDVALVRLASRLTKLKEIELRISSIALEAILETLPKAKGLPKFQILSVKRVPNEIMAYNSWIMQINFFR